MTMLETLAQKAPYLAAVVFVVWTFVRAWQKEATRREHEEDRRNKFDLARMKELERIGVACHEHTRELNERTTQAINNAARVIEANTKIIGAVEERLNGGG
jgi:hypothetical protein